MTTRSVRLNGARIRQWISFGVDESGTYAPQVDTSTLPKELKKLAKKVNVAARSASFKTSGAKITGVLPSREGKAMDVDATAAEIETLLAGRAAGSADAERLNAVMTVIKPKLTTSQARQVIPKMRKVSEWTTYFPIAEKNALRREHLDPRHGPRRPRRRPRRNVRLLEVDRARDARSWLP